MAFQGQYIPVRLEENVAEENKDELEEGVVENRRLSSTTNELFEFFKDVDITKTSLHALITELNNKRDFSDNGIKKMIKQSKIKHGEITGKPKTIILVYPEHRDLDESTEPLYVSNAPGVGENERTI